MKLRPVLIVLIALMVALNLVLGTIVAAFKLPIFLDSVGIILAAILAGPWVAATVGVATTLLGSFNVNFAYWAFSGTAFLIGITAGWLAQRGFFRQEYPLTSVGLMKFIGWCVAAGLIIGVVATLASAPVKAIVFGGVTASGSDMLVVFFRKAGDSVNISVLKAQFASELPDKMIATLLAAFLAQSLSRRALTWFPGATAKIRGTA